MYYMAAPYKLRYLYLWGATHLGQNSSHLGCKAIKILASPPLPQVESFLLALLTPASLNPRCMPMKFYVDATIEVTNGGWVSSTLAQVLNGALSHRCSCIS